MGTISRPNNYSANTTISSSQVNDDLDTVYNEFNGSISATNLASGAVTTAKIADSNVTTAKIADGGVTPSKTSFTTYSTTETEVGKWIDGKTVYRKVINFGALPDTTTKSVAHGITTIETLVKVDVITTNSSPTRAPVPFVSDSASAAATGSISLTINNTNINIRTQSDRTNFTQTYVILEYTKV